MKWGAYCEKFGATPRNRVLEIFLTLRTLPLSVDDVAEETGLSKTTTSKMIEGMIKKEYILATRVFRGKQLYQLNKENKDVELFLKAYNAVLDEIVEEYSEKVVA